MNSDRIITQEMLKHVTLSKEECEAFKKIATKLELRDEPSGNIVTCYVRPGGVILFYSITPPSDGTTTARSRKPTDHTLWHRPEHGTPFLMDWGTKEAMEAKLAEMVVEKPAMTAGQTRELTEWECDLIPILQKNRPTNGYCTAVQRIPMGSTDGKGPWNGNPERWAEPGQTLKIVMVSTMGDFGLTDDLSADNGYGVRLDFDSAMIRNIRTQP